jgi:hypothetical protein
MEFNGLETEAVVAEAIKHVSADRLVSTASTLENINLLLVDQPHALMFPEATQMTDLYDISAAKRAAGDDDDDDDDLGDDDFEDDDFDDDFEDDYDEEDFEDDDMEEDFYEEDFDLEEDFDDEDFEDDFGAGGWDDKF